MWGRLRHPHTPGAVRSRFAPPRSIVPPPALRSAALGLQPLRVFRSRARSPHPSAPRGSLKSKANPPLRKKPFAFARARGPKCVSREKTRTTGRAVFFIDPQSRAASRQNAFRYDGSASGGLYIEADPIGLAGGLNIYSYVRGNPLTRADPMGLRDVIVAIWTSRFLEGSVGHIYVGELNSTTIVSQFPTPHGIEGTNTTLSWLDTVRAEGRAADYVYQVSVPNDAEFDRAAAAARAIPTWFAFPDGSTSTQCAAAASSSLRAGGVNGLPLGNPLLPNYLNTNLLIKSLLGSQAFRLPAAPW